MSMLGISALAIWLSLGAAVPLTAVPFTDVTLQENGFWARWVALDRDSVVPHNFQECEKAGKINNFRKAAGRMPGEHEGAPWEDSDVYKVIEGAAYCLAHQRDTELEKSVDSLIELIAAAQRPDGYLHTYFQLRGIDGRWKDDSNHETYCAGHLIEAAVAYFQATGKRPLLDVAIRFADHIDSVFGPGKIVDVPQHEEIELALVKLWRLTNEERYLKLAQFFVDQRGQMAERRPGDNGKPRSWGSTCQDHKPVREQTEIAGHAVRAMYLYSGVADLAAATGDPGYRDAVERIWANTTQRKMYITGGIGSTARHEGFTAEYDLPNDSAYCETCAAIALAFMSQRMALLTGEAQYADVVERIMYNGALSGVALDGKHFFYVNPLASAGQHHREPWFGCACCPTNVARFLPAIAGYAYAHRGHEVFINQYMAGRVEIHDGDDALVLTEETRYPWDGAIQIRVESGAKNWALRLRIPGWSQPPSSPEALYAPQQAIPGGVSLRVNGTAVPLAIDNGYACIDRQWQKDDIVELTLPMPIMRIKANEHVKADRDRTALQRGPMVYCVEGIDMKGDVCQLALPPKAKLTAEWKPELLGGVMTLEGKAQARIAESHRKKSVPFRAIPYYAWNNRDEGPMAVWLSEDIRLAQAVPKPTIASQSRVSASFQTRDSLAAVKDRIDPKSSNDQSIPRMTWWDHLGTHEWIQYDLHDVAAIHEVEVYWFDDTGSGQCRVPLSWRVLSLRGSPFGLPGKWIPLEATSEYRTAPNTFNRVTFKPTKTIALRLEVELQPGFSGGILEWRVK